MVKPPTIISAALILLAITISAGYCTNAYAQEKIANEYLELKGTISISGAWALYPMAIRWAEEFKKIYPDVKFDISAGGAGKGMSDVLSNMVDIGMVSRDIFPVEIEKGAYGIAVTKDAVVATVNKNNPFVSAILKRGIQKQSFIDIWVSGTINDWGQIFPKERSEKDIPIRVYTRSDACGAAETWAKYLEHNQEDLKGIGVYGDPGLAEAVIKDIFGVGFNNVNFAYDSKTKKSVEGLRVIPIDLNNSGEIEPKEDFYSDRDSLVSAIAQGTYPSPPARELYFVTNAKPQKRILIAFIEWVLADGQRFVTESGYINLTNEQLSKELDKIR